MDGNYKRENEAYLDKAWDDLWTAPCGRMFTDLPQFRPRASVTENKENPEPTKIRNSECSEDRMEGRIINGQAKIRIAKWRAKLYSKVELRDGARKLFSLKT
jgi:hypothetical protein